MFWTLLKSAFEAGLTSLRKHPQISLESVRRHHQPSGNEASRAVRLSEHPLRCSASGTATEYALHLHVLTSNDSDRCEARRSGFLAKDRNGAKVDDQSRQIAPFTTSSESSFWLRDGCTLPVSRQTCALSALVSAKAANPSPLHSYSTQRASCDR